MYRPLDRSAFQRTAPLALGRGETGDGPVLSTGNPVTYAEGERGLCRVADVLPALLAQYGFGAECAEGVTTVIFAPVETVDRFLTLSY